MLYAIVFNYTLGVSNELHDSYSVHVTDWEKYNILANMFKNEHFITTRGINHFEVVKHLVFLFL